MSDEQTGATTSQTGFFTEKFDSAQRTLEIVSKAMDAAQPNAVLSTPVVREDRTVIVLSELGGGVGAGYGMSAEGTGGGGGGGSFGRPVAMIEIGPTGAQWQPIVDVTKLGIALLTTLGAMALARRAMARVR